VSPQDGKEALMSAYTGVAILLLILFLYGIMLGIFVIISWASNREDKKKSLMGPPPGPGCSGARRLVGFSYREADGQSPNERAASHGWPGQRAGHGWGDER
jgi:hypothetical protein